MAKETTGNMMKNGKGYQIKQTRRFRQDMPAINDGLCSGDEISNSKIFSCSLQSLDFIAKYSSQIISDIVALISYPNLLWTRRQDLAIGFVHKIWVRNSPLVRGGLGSLVVLLLQEVPGNIQGHQSEIFMTRK